MAICVSLINMKGGVGKTTLATQIAWYAAWQLDKEVLLIDLDPQANASQSVMSPQTYVRYLDNGGLTVSDIFEQFTPTGPASGSPKKLDPSKVIYFDCNPFFKERILPSRCLNRKVNCWEDTDVPARTSQGASVVG